MRGGPPGESYENPKSSTSAHVYQSPVSGAGVDVGRGVGVGAGVTVGVGAKVGVGTGVAVGVAVGVGVRVGSGVVVGGDVGVGNGVEVGIGVTVGAGAAVGVDVAVGVWMAVIVALTLTATLAAKSGVGGGIALTICRGALSWARSWRLRRVLPSMATTSPWTSSLAWPSQAVKQAPNYSGSKRPKTRPNVSWSRVCCGKEWHSAASGTWRTNRSWPYRTPLSKPNCRRRKSRRKG